MRFEPIPANFLSRPDAILLSKRFSVANEVIPRPDLGYLDVNAPSLTDNQINDIVNAYNTLVMQVTSNSVGINEVASITGLPAFSYKIYLERVVISQGAVNDGTLNFSSDTTGVYIIEVVNGNASAYAEVVVS